MEENSERLLVTGLGDRVDAFSARLSEMGFVVDKAKGEEKTLSLVQAGHYQLLLVESSFAREQKYRILKRVRATEHGGSIPIVVYSDRDGIETDSKSLEEGADDYLYDVADPALVRFRFKQLIELTSLRSSINECSTEISSLRKLSNDFKQVILPIGIALSAEKDLGLLLEKILVEAKSVCHADAGTLYLRTEEDTLKFEIMHTDSLNIRLGGSSGKEIKVPPLLLRDPKTGKPNHHNVASHVALEGVSINIPDIYHAEGFDFSGTKTFDRTNKYRSTSSLTVPLTNHDAKVIGVLQLLNAQDQASGKVKPFDAYLQQIVELLASQASVALSNQILMQREKKLLKFETDVQIGRKIQTDFLPDKLPQPAGCEVVACFHPAREVSGDFFDAFMLPGSSHMGFVIADVCDKGVPAALFMAVIRSLIRAFSERSTPFRLPILTGSKTKTSGSVEHKLTTLYEDLNALNTVLIANDYIARTHSRLSMFATLFLGVIDPESGLLTYINGGHEAPAIVGRTGIKERLGQTGPAVGMMPDAEFGLSQYQLEDHDILFSYTDGVPETRSADGAFFTEKRLFSLLEEPVDSAAALVKRVESHLTEHIGTADQFDDITMLAVGWSKQSKKENG